MAFIRNTDRLIEGSSKLFFSNIRAKAAVQSDLDLLASDISAEESARMSEDSGIKLRLDVIEGGAGVSGSIAKAQADAQAYADQKVAALVNSAPAVLDTLKELSDALGGDANFATTIAGQVGDVDDRVDQEILDRQTAINGVEASLASEVASLEGQIEAEQLARESAVNGLDGRLDVLEQDPVTKAYVDAEILELDGMFNSFQGDFDGRLDVLEGSGEGSVAKAEQDAKDYTDSKIGELEGNPDVASFVGALATSVFGAISAEQSRAEGEEASMLKLDGSRPMTGELNVGGFGVISTVVDAGGNEGLDLAYELNGASVTVSINNENTSTFVSGQLASENLSFQKTMGEQVASATMSFDLSGDNQINYVFPGVQGPANSILKNDGTGQFSWMEVSEITSAVEGRLDALEVDPTTQSYVDGIESALDARLDIIEGLDSVEGSVAKAEKDAKDYADSLDSAMDARVSSLESDPVTKTYVDGEVSSLDSRLDVIEGVGEGSVSKAEQDAKDYADAQIAALVNSAPAVLDTLKELSDALGGDENFSTTIANQIGGLDSRLDVLEGIGEGSVSKAEQDAKDYADSLNSAMDSRVDALELDPVTKTYVDAMTTSDIAEGTNLYYTQGRFDSAFSAKSTSNLSEGSNLYYTQARFDSAFAGKSSTDLAEGTKLFFTDARAKSAAIVNSSAGSQTDQAMSVSSAKSYIDTADNLRVKLDGTAAMTAALNFSGTLGLNQAGASVISAAAGQMLVFSRGMRVPYLSVSASSTVAAPSGYITGVTSTAAPRVITLPAASAMGAGRMLVIKDESGAASATNYIRIQGSAGQTVDGDAYYDIVVPYESVMIYTNGTNWFII